MKKFGKPIVCNEDDKAGEEGAKAAEACVAAGASWGLMLPDHNQKFPFAFDGPADDPAVYAALKRLTTPPDRPGKADDGPSYFPPPESKGGWRKLDKPEDVRRLAGMDPDRLAELKKWLLALRQAQTSPPS